MRHYNILPTKQIKAVSLSKEALKRLTWIDWYFNHCKNAELTCRHFGISKSVFYRWFHRYDKKNLKTLEFDTKLRRPHRLREMTTNPKILKLIYDIRLADLSYLRSRRLEGCVGSLMIFTTRDAFIKHYP